MATRPQTRKSSPLASMVGVAVLTLIPASLMGMMAGTISVGESPGMFNTFVHPNFWTAFVIAFGATELLGLIVGYKVNVAGKR